MISFSCRATRPRAARSGSRLAVVSGSFSSFRSLSSSSRRFAATQLAPTRLSSCLSGDSARPSSSTQSGRSRSGQISIGALAACLVELAAARPLPISSYCLIVWLVSLARLPPLPRSRSPLADGRRSTLMNPKAHVNIRPNNKYLLSVYEARECSTSIVVAAVVAAATSSSRLAAAAVAGSLAHLRCSLERRAPRSLLHTAGPLVAARSPLHFRRLGRAKRAAKRPAS
jgi:hypothetical protein